MCHSQWHAVPAVKQPGHALLHAPLGQRPPPNPAHPPTSGQLLQDGGLEGSSLPLANLGGRHVLPSDGELGG